MTGVTVLAIVLLSRLGGFASAAGGEHRMQERGVQNVTDVKAAASVAGRAIEARGPHTEDSALNPSRETGTGTVPHRPDGNELVGTEAPELGLDHWLNSGPMSMRALRGRVVLVRWWTDTCAFCAASAPALVQLDRKYRERGLIVIGVFHPKPPGDRSVERMRRAADSFAFTFPVALDADWSALRRWWLGRVPDGWTSVTFLVDREGSIRYMHPGGEYHEGESGEQWPDHGTCRREYAEIEATIVRLLGTAPHRGAQERP